MNDLLSSTEAAQVLGVHPATLANWRVWMRGPRYVRKGRRVFYKRAEIDKWKTRNALTAGGHRLSSTP